MKQSGQDKGTLLLALIAGLSINGTFAAIFSSIVPFSIFPLIALVLTVYCLHQRYLNRTMPVGLPGLAAACFILGVLLYSTVVRAEYPDICLWRWCSGLALACAAARASCQSKELFVGQVSEAPPAKNAGWRYAYPAYRSPCGK